jgi:hemerythrin-like domain-containing protein
MSATTEIMTETTPVIEETSATWADGPYALIPSPLTDEQRALKYDQSKLHGAEFMAHEMSMLHNHIIRGLNSIWQQAPFVQSETDIKDFLQYCQLWVDHIHAHHNVEEDFFFPQLETLVGKPGCMEPNIAQHRAFESGLDRFSEHLKATTPASYSAGALRAVLSSFGHILREHLSDEIPTLLALREFDSSKLKKVFLKSGAYARSHGESAKEFPFIVGTHDKSYQGGSWTEFNFPTPLYWINDLIFSRKYTNAWRFLPCDMRSNRRDLTCGPNKA